MKYFFCLFAFTLLFISCDSSVNSTDKQNQIGVIHKIDMSSWMYGTHTLDDPNGKPLYALTSTTIDLNNYENK